MRKEEENMFFCGGSPQKLGEESLGFSQVSFLLKGANYAIASIMYNPYFNGLHPFFAHFLLFQHLSNIYIFYYKLPRDGVWNLGVSSRTFG